MKNKIFFAAMILMAASFIGIAVIDDAEESDAAGYYRIDAKQIWERGNSYANYGTEVAIVDWIGVENGITVKYSATPNYVTVTQPISGYDWQRVEIEKTNYGTGALIDESGVWFAVNDEGLEFQSAVRYWTTIGNLFLLDRQTSDETFFDFWVTFSEPTPPTGATFLGWSETANASTPTYTGGEGLTLVDYPLNLYAVWESQTIYTFTLNFNANGGTGAPSSLTYSGTETSHAFTIPNTIPTWSGHTFYGWSNNPNNELTGYEPGETKTLSITSGSATKTETMYAVWDIPVRTVNFTVNDQTKGTVSTASISVLNGTDVYYEQDHSLTIGNYNIVPTPTTGNTFSGWSNNTGDTVYTILSNVTFTANFSVSLFDVTFDNQYSPNGTVSPSVIRNVPYGTSVTVNNNQITINGVTVTATPYAGYSFDHWWCIVPQTYQNIPSTVTGTMRITAYFSDDRTFTLSYDMKGGSPQIPTDTSIMGPTATSANFNISWTIPTKSNYTFLGWSVNSAATSVDYNPGEIITVTWSSGGSQTLYAVWQEGGNRIFNLIYNMNGGSPQLDTQTYTGNSGTVSHRFVIPATEPTKEGYDFEGWSESAAATSVDYLPNTSVLVSWDVVQDSGDKTLYAVWTEQPQPVIIDGVYWSNELYNGSVTLACRFSGGNSNATHLITVPLYVGTVTTNSQPEWSRTAYELEISMSYPNTMITVTLKNNGTTVSGYPITTNIGKWPGFEITIDADRGLIEFTPMDRFNNYTSYTTYTSRTQTIADWSEITSGNAIYEIKHKDEGAGAHMSFQAVRTMTFLDTFGVVMTDPSINVYDYFPDYEKVRLNFYSFALYGDDITINGKTFSVYDGSVTVYYYTTYDKVNHWARSPVDIVPGPGGQNYTIYTKTLTLSNIYVTWNGDTCSLTFVNDKFTVDLGGYSASSETVSFTGFWYFTTTLYEPITVTEKSIEGGWKALPDIGGPAMILLYLGAILGLGLIAHIKIGLKWLDLTILTIGMVLGFALLG